MPLIPVQPTGTRRSAAFVDGVRNGKRFGELQEIDLDVYPESHNSILLRAIRLDRRLSFREVAKMLGLTALEYCDLERGRRTFSEASEWEAAIAKIRGAKSCT
jgi:hypothetical protein